MRILGLDIGTKTVGVAISDLLGITAQGIETIKVDTENNNFGFKRLSQLINDYNICAIVIGIPKNMNGTLGKRAIACEVYADKLEKKFLLPVYRIDERLTTRQAERVLISADVRRKKGKTVIDKMAAVLILQNYLEINNNNNI